VTGLPLTISRSLSPTEHAFLTSYRTLLTPLKGLYLDIDLGGPLTPPKDMYMAVRVLKEIGEVFLVSGEFKKLSVGSHHYMLRGDAADFIRMGLMVQIR
jgi:GINS complex subunit 1